MYISTDWDILLCNKPLSTCTRMFKFWSCGHKEGTCEKVLPAWWIFFLRTGKLNNTFICIDSFQNISLNHCWDIRVQNKLLLNYLLQFSKIVFATGLKISCELGYHKIFIYLEYLGVCPLVPPPFSRKGVCPPGTKGRGVVIYRQKRERNSHKRALGRLPIK